MNRKKDLFAFNSKGYSFSCTINIKILPSIERNIQMISTITRLPTTYDFLLFDTSDGRILSLSSGLYSKYGLDSIWCYNVHSLLSIPLNITHIFPEVSIEDIHSEDKWKRKQKLDACSLYNILMIAKPRDFDYNIQKYKVHEVKTNCKPDTSVRERSLSIAVVTFLEDEDRGSFSNPKSRSYSHKTSDNNTKYKYSLKKAGNSRNNASDSGNNNDSALMAQMDKQDRIRKMKEIREQFSLKRYGRSTFLLGTLYCFVLLALNLAIWMVLYVQTKNSSYANSSIEAFIQISNKHRGVPLIQYQIQKIRSSIE